VLSPDPLSPTPSTSPAVKTPENTKKKNRDDSEAADKGDIHIEYSSD
jgi:hypothetical protein